MLVLLLHWFFALPIGEACGEVEQRSGTVYLRPLGRCVLLQHRQALCVPLEPWLLSHGHHCMAITPSERIGINVDLMHIISLI
jgi:hypothetical protein